MFHYKQSILGYPPRWYLKWEHDDKEMEDAPKSHKVVP